MSDSREEFEAVALRFGFSLKMRCPESEDGEYLDVNEQDCWNFWQAACEWQASAVVLGGLALVPAIATREIEDAIGRNRNMKASEIWEVAVSVASKNVQQPSAVVPEWIEFSERFPTEDDEDFNSYVWVIYSGSDIEILNVDDVEAYKIYQISADEAEWWPATHWMPTGLKRPAPPEQEQDTLN
jgi:hypothetical protein